MTAVYQVQTGSSMTKQHQQLIDQLLRYWSQAQQYGEKAETTLGKLLAYYRQRYPCLDNKQRTSAQINRLLKACKKTRGKHSEAYYYHLSVEEMLQQITKNQGDKPKHKKT